jgi:methionyl-tRNA formyltransferase
VKRAAEARGVRVLTPEKLRPFTGELRALGADAFVVASYGKIVPQMLLDAVPIAFNVHPSLLPLYRGATPLQSAIRDGRDETGVTIIAMDAGMDTGDVLLQERTPIGPEETYGELHDRLAQRGAELVLDAVEAHANGTLTRTPQSELARRRGITEDEIARTLTRPLRKEDLAIDWYRPARAVVDQVRSLSPQPLARARCLDETVKVIAAHALSRDEFARTVGGMVETVPRSLTAAAAYPSRTPLVYGTADDGAVIVDRLIAPNRGPMSGEAFARSVYDRAGVDPNVELGGRLS